MKYVQEEKTVQRQQWRAGRLNHAIWSR